MGIFVKFENVVSKLKTTDGNVCSQIKYHLIYYMRSMGVVRLLKSAM